MTREGCSFEYDASQSWDGQKSVLDPLQHRVRMVIKHQVKGRLDVELERDMIHRAVTCWMRKSPKYVFDARPGVRRIGHDFTPVRCLMQDIV